MSAAPVVSHITAKQRAADVANLRKARAVARRLPRTGKQKAASRRNLAIGRAVQKARRSGKGAAPVKAAKKAAAPLPRNLDLSGAGATELAFGLDLELHTLPVCGPVALAEHLLACTGAMAGTSDILELWRITGITTLGELFEAAAEHGLAGNRLSYFERCDPGYDIPGISLIYGVQLHRGYHAALAVPGAMISWCTLVPRDGTPEEAWWLEWEGE